MPSDSPPGPTSVNHAPGPTDTDSVTEEVGLGSLSPPFLPSQDCPQECSPPNLDPQVSACTCAPLSQSCRPTRKSPPTEFVFIPLMVIELLRFFGFILDSILITCFP